MRGRRLTFAISFLFEFLFFSRLLLFLPTRAAHLDVSSRVLFCLFLRQPTATTSSDALPADPRRRFRPAAARGDGRPPGEPPSFFFCFFFNHTKNRFFCDAAGGAVRPRDADVDVVAGLPAQDGLALPHVEQALVRLRPHDAHPRLLLGQERISQARRRLLSGKKEP